MYTFFYVFYRFYVFVYRLLWFFNWFWVGFIEHMFLYVENPSGWLGIIIILEHKSFWLTSEPGNTGTPVILTNRWTWKYWKTSRDDSGLDQDKQKSFGDATVAVFGTLFYLFGKIIFGDFYTIFEVVRGCLKKNMGIYICLLKMRFL